MKKLTTNQILEFQTKIHSFYSEKKRFFPWREKITPYKILISEVMLQQTQTARVIPKFENWIKIFPDFAALSQATNHEILSAWQGLGYNRRGLALGKIAQAVMSDHEGVLPSDLKTLITFPAIGVNTAASIAAFAFNSPTVFIETNIRTVYSHTFFTNEENIDDKKLLPLIEQTVYKKEARQWYYALMDYGVHLKKSLPRINAASKHYAKQSKFEGSKRQVRGAIVKILTQVEQATYEDLIDMLAMEIPRNENDPHAIIETLIKENIIYEREEKLCL